MSQRQQLERLFEIDRQVRAGFFPNADSLARELGVSRRVIFKDRAFMIERLRAPLATDRRRGGWYYTDLTWTLPNIQMTQGELLALFISVELAQRYMGTDLQEPLLSAMNKLECSLKADVTVDLDALRAHYTFAAPPLMSVNSQTLLDIHRAVSERRLLGMTYFANTTGERSERVVEPYHVHNYNGDWYLLAFDRSRQDRRTFHVGRILEYELLPDRFERRASIVIADWIQSAFGVEGGGTPVEVVIAFDSYQARWIRERQWHPTAQLEPHPDGSVILHLRVSGLGEVKRWVMQYGSRAKVLAPESLRLAVAEEARKMIALYAAE